jgi:hypothetical protein
MALQDILAEIAVGLRLDTADYSSGVAKAEAATGRLERRLGTFQAKAGRIGSTMAGLAGGLAGGLVTGLSVDALMRAVSAGLEYAGSLGEVSQQLGVTTRDLQVFRYAASQVGVKQETLETGLGKLTITLGKLAAGAKEPAKALAAIGISADQLKGKDTGEALRIIADGLAKIPDRAQRAAVEVALFGKSGAQLDNLLAGGSKSVNELAAAADELGIVLSDEQIKKADATADKLAALKTVLAARIAGDVADNSNAILQFADALLQLANAAATAKQFLGDLTRNWSIPAMVAKAKGRFEATQLGVAGNSVRVPLSQGGTATEEAKRRGLKLAQPGGAGGVDIGKFLAGGGGGGRGKRDNSAEELLRKRLDALRDQYDFDQQILRAQEGVLQAQQDVATNTGDRTNIATELLDLDRRGYTAQLAYEVKVNELTKGAEGKTQAQADQLLALYDITDGFKRQALTQKEIEENQRDLNQLSEVDFELKRTALEGQEQLARTAAERRAIELRLVALAFEEERQRLERITRESKDWKEIEEARRRLAALPGQQAQAQRGAMQSTMGPRESYLDQLPRSLGDVNERLQEIEARGLNSLKDDLASSAAAALGLEGSLGNIASDLIRLGLDTLESSVRGLFGGANAGIDAAQGAQQAATASAMTAAGTAMSAAGGTLSAAGGTLTAAGTTLTAAGTTLVAGAAPLATAGVGLSAGGTMLTSAAAMWMATAAQIQAAAAMLMAANAAGSIGGGVAGARAGGGPVMGGKSYLVGEKGPEIFTPSFSGRIIANDQLPGLGGGGDGLHLHLAVPRGMSAREARATGRQLGAGARDAIARSTGTKR